MFDFFRRNFTLLSIILGTLAIIVGGVFLFSRGQSASQKISNEILVPSGANVIGGISNGVYQPANKDPKVVLVEFGDYQCPACATYNPLVKKLLTDFNGKINVVFRNYPLSQHANAPISSNAAEAAGLQGKFWQMHDKLYDNQGQWATSSDAKSIFAGYAKELGLNVNQFNSDIDSQKVKDRVSRDQVDGNLVKLNATPTFYVNGVKVSLLGSYDEFKKIVNDAIENTASSPTSSQAYHTHFDIKIYLSGKRVDLGLAKYQSSEGKELNPDIHLHGGNGNIVHIHKQGATLGELFDSLKMKLTSSCFTLDNGQKFCNSSANTLKLVVNGKLVNDFETHAPQDLDRILISFGPKEDKNLTIQKNSVTDLACIYSEKCPERGTPLPESCVGGLGTGCSE